MFSILTYYLLSISICLSQELQICAWAYLGTQSATFCYYFNQSQNSILTSTSELFVIVEIIAEKKNICCTGRLSYEHTDVRKVDVLCFFLGFEVCMTCNEGYLPEVRSQLKSIFDSTKKNQDWIAIQSLKLGKIFFWLFFKGCVIQYLVMLCYVAKVKSIIEKWF